MRKISIKNVLRRPTKGQSLVEMAIITPILIFFLIGVFEVGWALRNYLVLVNVNREITRFAVRPGYLDFSTQDDIDTSFVRVKEWATSSVSEQLLLDFTNTGDINHTGSTTLIISHAVIDTGKPCEDIGDTECDDCSAFEDPSYNPFPQDDLILHASLPGYEVQQSATIGPPETVTGVRVTRIDFDALVEELKAKNNEFNCNIMKKNGVPSSNNIIITELFHDQPQLFGFPLISNPYTDPVPLYTHTAMRLISAARSGGGVEGSVISGIDTIGPICLVYPMLANSADISSPDLNNIVANGWLKWGDLIADNEEYLEYAVLYPQMSLNDFDDPGGVKIGNQVNKVTGTFSNLTEELDTLVGARIIIPTSSDPTANPVTVDGFVWATIESYNLASNEVMARFDTTTPLPASCN